MPVRSFVQLVCRLVICLTLALGTIQSNGLSRAAEPADKPSEPPPQADEAGTKDAAKEKPKEATKDEPRDEPKDAASGAAKDAAKPATEDAASPDAQQQLEDDFELLELFADTLDQVERNYVKDVTRRQLMEAAIRGMLRELDPYSNFIPPKQLDRFKVEVENEFGGVGIQVSLENGQLRVISPLVGSPAYRAGVLSGDVITEIGGEGTKDITLDEAVQRMKGPVGTKVKIKVLHAGAGEPVEVELERDNIRVETVLGDARNADDSWHWLVDQEHGIGYIRLTGFGRHTTEDLQKTLQQLADQKFRGLILDLRFNPGGLLSSAIEVSDLFVAEGRIVSTEGRNVVPRTWDARDEGTYNGFPMAVLVNRYSASASEIVAACLQDHNRAVIIGERTWGKGSVQNVIELEGGASALKLTTAGYHRPNGKNIHRAPDATDDDDWGVLPNPGFEVKLTGREMTQLMEQRRDKDIVRKANGEAKPEVGEAAGEPLVDSQLQKALEYIRGQQQELQAKAPAAEPAGKEEPQAEAKAAPDAKPEAGQP